MMRRAVCLIVLLPLFATLAFCQNGDLEMRIFKIKYRSPESLYEAANNLKSANGRVSFDSKTNSIIALDYPANIERIGDLIDMLDVREKQVEIKVEIIETTAEFLDGMGIKAAKVVIPAEKFLAIADLIKTDKSTKTSSEMTVRALSNQPAYIGVVSDAAIDQEVVVLEDGTQVVQPLRQSIGKTLEVIPRVNDDGMISLILRPTLSTLEEGATPYERTVLTRVEVADGDTVAIGSFDENQEASESADTLFGIPVFSGSQTEGKKVVMFLTAYIIK